MRFQGAVIQEQGVTFAIVIVKAHILNNHTEANRLITSFQRDVFGPIPVVLMTQDFQGTPTYYGRQDIADFLSSVPLHSIPWQEYTLS